MIKHNENNERIKHKYIAYLEEAKRLSTKSADVAASAIADFERSTKYKDFKAFHIEQAKKYKRDLSEAINVKTKKPLAKATIHARLNAVKAFFMWLADQNGYKSKITYSDCDYFNLSANDTRIATASRPVNFPSVEQVKQTIAAMPLDTDIKKRNRALVAFTLLTCARVDALRTFKISHVDLVKGSVFQDAKDVSTKFRKTGQTTFFPVGSDMQEIIKDWITHLIDTLHFRQDDPLFPSTLIQQDESNTFVAAGLKREHWQSTSPIRDIFKAAFEGAGFPYFHPHSLRHTIAQLGERVCRTPEELKAWSQNMLHENVLTMFTSYGKVADHRQAELIQDLGKKTLSQVNQPDTPDAETIAFVLDHLKNKNQ